MHRALLFALALAACARAPAVDPEAEARAIRAVSERQAAAFAAHDPIAAVAAYADDATMYAPGAAVSDAESVREGMEHMLADPNTNLSFTTDRIAVSEDGRMAFSTGTYAMTMQPEHAPAPTTERGHFVTVWRKQPDGQWRIVTDINTPGPLTAPASAPAP